MLPLSPVPNSHLPQTPVPPLPHSHNNHMDIQKLIGVNFRIEVKDGRLVDGFLSVVDPFGNVLLSGVKETSKDKLNPSILHTRELGLVSVPRDQVVRIFIPDEDVLEATDIRSRLLVDRGTPTGLNSNGVNSSTERNDPSRMD